jgi:hypothetical protein
MGRPRFRLRTLLVAILGLALLCGGLAHLDARQRRRAAARARLALQRQVTDAALAPAYTELSAAGHRPLSGRILFTAPDAPGDLPWSYEADVRASAPGLRPALIRVRIEGVARDGPVPAPLAITDLGAPHNARVIERLAEAYRQRGWPYRIIPAATATAARP